MSDNGMLAFQLDDLRAKFAERRILLHGSARTTPAIRTEIKELYNTKKLKVKEISRIFNISRPTVYYSHLAFI